MPKGTKKNQCECFNARGTRCKNPATKGGIGLCLMHASTGACKRRVEAKPVVEKGKCECTTKSGSRCRKPAAKGSRFCGFHARIGRCGMGGGMGMPSGAFPGYWMSEEEWRRYNGPMSAYPKEFARGKLPTQHELMGGMPVETKKDMFDAGAGIF